MTSAVRGGGAISLDTIFHLADPQIPSDPTSFESSCAPRFGARVLAAHHLDIDMSAYRGVPVASDHVDPNASGEFTPGVQRLAYGTDQGRFLQQQIA
jgi:hypothetical protein